MTSLSSDERLALQQMHGTFPTLEQWRSRSRSAEKPELGSESAADDRIWPWLPPSEIARQSLSAATQHLNLARTAIEAMDIYPISHFTVIRGALVGASQAVWILAPDIRPERQQRALRVIDEWYRRALQHAAECQSLIDDPNAQLEREPEIAHMQARKNEARALWHGTENLSAAEGLNLTNLVVWSAGHVLRNPLEAAFVKPLWHELSGDAHALGWSVMTRSTTLAERDGGGMAVFKTGGDLMRLRDAFLLSYRILRQGWSLFDRRCEGCP